MEDKAPKIPETKPVVKELPIVDTVIRNARAEKPKDDKPHIPKE